MTPVPYLRTPDESFNTIPDFPYRPQYLTHNGLRIAYIDEHNATSAADEPDVFLCLHGQPTWSYLYRKMIPVLLNHTTRTSLGPRRVVCPDLLGFGRSDKPRREEDYTFHFHRNMLLHVIRKLDLRNITLVVQDWGGLLGLTLPTEEPSRFKRLLVMNTTIAAGAKPTEGFVAWKAYNNSQPDMDIGRLIGRGTPHLSKEEIAAYNAPYPSVEYKSGVRRFPNLVMVDAKMDGADESRRSLDFFKTNSQFGANDIFMACGMADPVLGPQVMAGLAKVWRNGCLWTEIGPAGHFVQEWGDIVAQRAIEAFENDGKAEGVVRKSTMTAAPKL